MRTAFGTLINNGVRALFWVKKISGDNKIYEVRAS